MFGFRTPVNVPKKDSCCSTSRDPRSSFHEEEAAKAKAEAKAKAKALEANSDRTSNVRRSIGEWETGKKDSSPKITTTPKKTAPVEAPKCKGPSRSLSQEKKAGPQKSTEKAGSPPAKSKHSERAKFAKTPPKTTAALEPPKPNDTKTLSQESRTNARKTPTETTGSPTTQTTTKHPDRLAEAKACVTKAKLNLGNSRNTKTEIKTAVTQAIDRLYQLVKEAEAENAKGKESVEPVIRKATEPEKPKEREPEQKSVEKENELKKIMEEHAKLIKDNNEKMEKLKETIEKEQERQEKLTYASVAAASTRRQPMDQTALHSVVVTAKDEEETGEQVLQRIREVVNAKDSNIEVERIRKAKDRKVIMGCRTEAERTRLKERLETAKDHLNVEEVKNKNPLVIMRDVFKYNSDDDILSALVSQNKNTFRDIDMKKQDLEIVYKKKTNNPHTHHVVMRVPPTIWQRLTEAGLVRIDLQLARVADQSPLVQCSLCLGYGHGRRFCAETSPKCSHCGGPHMWTECSNRRAGAAPSCCNCALAKIEKADHNAFSSECTLRRKWDALARATIAYC